MTFTGKHRLITIGFLFALMLAVYPGGQAQAATITSNGTGGGNWNTAATWAGGGVPGPGGDAVIANGDTVTVTNLQQPDTLTVNAGGTLQHTGGVFRVNGTVDVSGTINQTGGVFDIFGNFTNGGTFNGTGGQTRFRGAVPKTINNTGSTTFFDLVIVDAGGTTLTPGQTIIVRNDLVNGGTFDGNSATIELGGNWNNSNPFNGNNSTVRFNGGATSKLQEAIFPILRMWKLLTAQALQPR